MLGSYWSELPIAAKRYILYHALITPLLFAWWVVPYLMLTTGMTIFEAGIFYSIAQAVSAFLTFLVGRSLDRHPPNIMIVATSIVEAASYVIYYFAFKLLSPALILLGLIVEIGSGVFYPAFPVYEHAVYPEEMREKAFAYHNIVPYLSQALTFPLIGYTFGVFLDTVEGMVTGLLVIAFLNVVSVIYPLRILPWIRPVSYTHLTLPTTERV